MRIELPQDDLISLPDVPATEVAADVLPHLDEAIAPLSSKALTPEIFLPEDTITLPEGEQLTSVEPVTEVNDDLVYIDLPQAELILPSTEPASADMGNDSELTDMLVKSAETKLDESVADIGVASSTESEVLKGAVDKLPPTDI